MSRTEACLLVSMFGMLANCSAGVVAPAWYPPQGCRDCYQGEGVGPDYQTALARARKTLCDDILVVVESETTDARRQLLHQTLDGKGNATETMDYKEVVHMVSTSRSRCVFDNMPVDEQRADAVDQSFVVLRMGIAEYARYLAGRTVQVLVRTKTADVTADAAVSAVTDHLRGDGYLVVTAGGHAEYLGTLSMSASVQDAGVQFAGMLVASGQADWVLVRAADGTEVERVHVGKVGARGFKEQSVLHEFGAAVAAALRKEWGIE